MSTLFKHLCVSLAVCSFHVLSADAPSFYGEEFTEFSQDELVKTPLQETAKAPVSSTQEKPFMKTAEKMREVPFTSFTGKVKAKKLRVRLDADVDSRIIKELNKDEFVSIIGEKGDFWAVQPPSDIKAYIFRSFVLDNVIEGNRVNVRLEPNLEAPVIAHLNSGYELDHPVISPINNKWFEIKPPANTQFYVAKEYIEYAGGPELKAQIDRRHATCKQLLDATAVLSQAELKKPFDEIDFDRIIHNFNVVIKEYAEFSELTEQAREAVTAFQEAYLEKRIAYLESRPSQEQLTKEESHRLMLKEVETALFQVTDRMKNWEPVEESLYASWASINGSNSQKEFYEDQKLTAVVLTGWIEPYNSPVKNKPGDFIIRNNEIPIGYIYSTQINLQTLIGKHVTLVASPRSNHNFAFPAYYVLAVE